MIWRGTTVVLWVSICLAAVGFGPDRLLAQSCVSPSARPAVCSVELFVAAAGQRPQRLDPSRPIVLNPNASVELSVDALDQSRRRFPEDRLRFGSELDARCRGLVSLRELGTGRFELRTNAAAGRCRLWLWVPGNLNLEWPLDLEVVSQAKPNRGKGSYSRADSEIISTCLYKGLLGRAPDAAGARDTVSDIEKGRLGERVRQILRSSEYKNKSRGMSSFELLEQIYLGVLQRRPDPAGIASFQRRVERGRVAEVVLELLRSEEFDQRVLSDGN